ncbi:MAG TPA: branched-chain amino acid ABC transporter substrate-binding protein [Urbifossiella sp.]|nr:branched-chain amino acid ABC transporter substrate-binding protein [Urbifossiella sp.]
MDRRRFLALAGGTAASLLPGCSSNSSASVVKIISSMPRTGSAKGQTDTIANGIRMAIEEYNGVIAGMQIEYLDLDDATAAAGSWTSDLESGNARKAAADPDVIAFIGPYNSGAAMVSMPILNKAPLLQVSPATTWVGLTKKFEGAPDDIPGQFRPTGNVTFCRVCPTDETQGPMGADFAKDHLKAKSVYILDDKEIYGQGVSGLFHKQCEKIGIAVLGHESINVSQQDFTPLMTGIKAKNPDMLYFGGTTQSKGGQIAKDMIKVGLACPLMVPDGCYEKSFIESAGADNLGNCYATMGGVDWPKLEGPGLEYVKRYQAKYGDPEAYSIYGYEAAKLVLESVRKVGRKDREAVLATALATKDFDQGALGKWSFDADGDISIQKLTISRILGGKFVPQVVLDKKK